MELRILSSILSLSKGSVVYRRMRSSIRGMLYLFHGPDEFTRNEKIAALRAELGDPALAELNVAVLEGRDLTLSDIRQHADSMPFLAAKRLVVVKNYLNSLRGKAEEIETLVNYLQD